MITATWHGVDTGSVETCSVREAADGIEVGGVVRGRFGSCRYALTADAAWNFRSLSFALDARVLIVDFDGIAWRVDGRTRPDLADAREVDISISPMSNTLPIRRLGLTVGQQSDITTAYLSVPDLTVVADPQRYTRLNERQYLYESRDSDFSRVVTVDPDGLVLSYPGLFTRA